MINNSKLNGVIDYLRLPGFVLLILVLVLSLLLHWFNIGTTIDPPFLYFFLNCLFIGIPVSVVMVIALRGFLHSGVWPVLWLGLGTITFGIGKILSSLFIVFNYVNAAITASDLIFLLSSLLYAIGAFFILFNIPALYNQSSRLSATLQIYVTASLITILILLLVTFNVLPPPFIHETGNNLIRQAILGSTALLYLFTSLILLQHYWLTKSKFLYWYSLGLLLISLGLIIIFLQSSIETPLLWMARVAHLLAGLYLLLAAFVTYQEAHTKKIPAHQALVSFLQTQGTNLNLLFNSLSEAVIIADQDSSITAWNKAAENVYGWKAEEVIGKNVQEILPTGYISNPLSANRHFGREARGIWKSEALQKNKNGQAVFTLVSASPLKNESGLGVGSVYINSDITEFKQAEAGINRQMQVIQAADRILRKALKTHSEKELGKLALEMAEKITVSKFGYIGKLNDQGMEDLAISNPDLNGCIITGSQYHRSLPDNFQTHGLLGRVLLEGKTLLSNEPACYLSNMTLPQGHPLVHSFLGIPLKNENEILGIIAVADREGGYTPEQQEDLEQLAAVIVEVFLKIREERSLIDYQNQLEARIKENTRELELSEEKYRVLVEAANEAILVDQDGMLKFVNNKAVELLGYSREELVLTPFADYVHPDDRELVIARHQKRLRGESVPNVYECRVIHKNRSTKWVALNTCFINWEGQLSPLVLLTDITQRKQMELSLKEYALKITQVQEEERKRIAYELHDDTAQYLAILKLQLDSLIHSGKIQDPEILDKLIYLEKDAGRAVDDVRRYSHELRPAVLEHLGIVAALEQISEDFNKLKEISVEINVEGFEPELREEIKLGLFRIAQEALNNVRKHARASKAIIKMVFLDNRIILAVKDDGLGFDVTAATSQASLRGSLGLISMHERAKLIGADFKIESKPGKGTLITAIVSF